jgi:Ca2+-binding EF-hand superfamily protein
MEASPVVNKKALKKEFKQVYPKYDPEKTKVVSKEDAAKIVVECMTNCGQQFSAEEANKILDKFDLDKNNQIAKNEVKSTLLIGAKLEELTEKMIQKMKKKWEKKQNKKKKASKEEKKKAKELKKFFKSSFKELMKQKLVDKHAMISFADAEAWATTLMNNMSVDVDKDKMMDLFAAIDSSNEGALTKKELKLACKQMVGLRDVDLEKAQHQRNKWKKKQEKKKMKELKKQEKANKA